MKFARPLLFVLLCSFPCTAFATTPDAGTGTIDAGSEPRDGGADVRTPPPPHDGETEEDAGVDPTIVTHGCSAAPGETSSMPLFLLGAFVLGAQALRRSRRD